MSRRPLPAIIMALLLAITWATDCLGQGFVVPERPSQFIDTSVIPTTSRTINVPAGGNLQDALNNAQPGDEIRLEGGATFQGPFTLPNKVGPGWIIIRPDAQTEAWMTAPGTRRTEAQLAFDLFICPRRQRPEAERALLAFSEEDAIKEQRVEMDVQIQSAANPRA